MRESEIVGLFRRMATHPAARGLADDAAVWSPPVGRELVLTHDMIAEDVHFLAGDDPSDIAWKLVAVNLSDLAAKGARPAGVLLGIALRDRDDAWLIRFAAGLERVLAEHDTALFGGDTVSASGPASFGLTAIGHAPRGEVLSRAGAVVGDDLYVTGTIGDAGLGLAIARGEAAADKTLLRRYRLPAPRAAVGEGLFRAGATAAMDVSDGLLLDASRLAAASAVRLAVELAAVPISEAAARRIGAGDEGRLGCASAGDDYELLFTAPAPARDAVFTLCERAGVRLSRIGCATSGEGLELLGAAGPIPMPARPGYEHGAE